MNKVEELRNGLLKAAAIAGSEVCLKEVRQHVDAALSSLTKAAKKQDKKEQGITPMQRWQLDLATGQMVRPAGPKEAKKALTAIEQMIADEQAKIDAMHQQPTPQQASQGRANQTLLD